MKKLILFLILINIFFLNFCGKTEINKPILEESSITFTYKADAGVQSVYLSGDFNSWRINDNDYKMAEKEAGVYKISVKKRIFKHGRNYYVFIVNGKWIFDQNAQENVDRGFAGKVSVLIINH
jgi:hypothetical protein